jgi:hypothetical protein
MLRPGRLPINGYIYKERKDVKVGAGRWTVSTFGSEWIRRRELPGAVAL